MKSFDFSKAKFTLIGLTTIVAIALAYFFSPAWLLILAIPLIALPVLRETGMIKDADEREQFSSYRSSHIALYLILIFLGFRFLAVLDLSAFHALELLPIIAIAVYIKVADGVSTLYSHKIAGVAFAVVIGTWWLLWFIAFMLGAVKEVEFIYFPAAFGAAYLLTGILSYFKPLIGAGLLSAIGLFNVAFWIKYVMRQYYHPISFQVGANIILVMPIFVAAFYLVVASRTEKQEVVE